MTFDEELKRAFDALGDRLHAEVQHQIEAAMAELRAVAPVEPAEAVPLSDTGTASVSDTQPLAASTDNNLLDVLAATRTMDEARTLTEVLDALTMAAARLAGGAAVRLRRGGRLEPWRAIGLDAHSDAPDSTRLPLVISGEEIGVLYADGGSAEALELLARHASRCLESMTAFKTARALACQADAPSGEPVGEEDLEEDAAARRYAKLLVSEIKLYHEPDVTAGRRDRDLASRLGGEIARARVLYDQRVPAQVRQRADYFRDELVRTLADGDSTLLEFHA